MVNQPGNSASINYGFTGSASLAVGQMKSYRFEADSGDVIQIRMSEKYYTLEPYIELFGPNGERVTSKSGSTNTRISDRKIAKSGTYTILAMDDDGLDAQGYGICLQVVNQPGNAKLIECGYSANDGLVVSQMKAYRFWANSGNIVTIHMSERYYTLEPSLELYSPQGARVAAHSHATLAQISMLTLEQDGYYTILAMDDDGLDAQGYALNLTCLVVHPHIYCGDSNVKAAICAFPDEVCIDLPISNADAVDAGAADWSDNTLCFTADHEGEYNFTVIATNTHGADTCNFSVNVTRFTPIEIDNDNLAFNTTDTSSASPDAQSIAISSTCDPGVANWQVQIQSEGGWLRLDKNSGSNPDTIAVSIADSSYTAGIYDAVMIFTDAVSGEILTSANISLFVESGVNVGDQYIEPGSIAKLPIILHTNEALSGFTIPLKYHTNQPAEFQLDSVSVDPNLVDSVIWNPGDSVVILFTDVHEPPLDDSTYRVGELCFSASASAVPEDIVIDTAIYENYRYEFVYASGDTVVPVFNPGHVVIGTEIRSLQLSHVTCAQGDSVGVPVIAKGVEGVAGVEFQVSYDPTIVVPTDQIVTSKYILSNPNFSDGMIYIPWEGLSSPITVPNGDTLMTLWFTGVGAEGEVSPLGWGNNYLSDSEGNAIGGWSFYDGSVTISATPDILSGSITYYASDIGIGDVSVDLSGSSSSSSLTSVAGRYQFSSVASGDYDLMPSLTDDVPGGTILDAVKMQRYIVGLDALTPYQMIAADMSDDCHVSVSDVVKLLRCIAHFPDRGCGDWVFVERALEIDDSTWCPIADHISTTMAGPSQMDLDFLGIRKGDIDGDYMTPPGTMAKSNGNAAEVTIRLDDFIGTEDGTIIVPIIISNDDAVSGLEIHVEYDPDQLTFQNASSDLSCNWNANASGGYVHLAWADIAEPIVRSDGWQVTQLRFQPRIGEFDPEAVSIGSAVAADLSGNGYRVSLGNGNNPKSEVSLPEQFILGQNYPNPFNPTTSIEFSLPVASDVQLEVYNLLGRRVVTLLDQRMEAGLHRIDWNSHDATGRSVASGVYFYRIETAQFTASRKMLLLK